MNTKFSNYLLYGFAVIGFISILSSFNNQTKQETDGTPESHVWEAYGAEGNWGWVLNKKTGEVFGLDANRKAKVLVQTLDKAK
tara:strand:- start:492 stop:740 length:249 start_codon:yes stop_codon:yes gene_type:complete